MNVINELIERMPKHMFNIINLQPMKKKKKNSVLYDN